MAKNETSLNSLKRFFHWTSKNLYKVNNYDLFEDKILSLIIFVTGQDFT